MASRILPAFAQNQKPARNDFFGEAAALRTAERSLREAGISFERHGLLSDEGGFGESLYAWIPSRSANATAGTLVIAAPLSSRPLGSGEEPSFAVEAALAFADLVAESGASLDVHVALLADELSQLPRDVRGRSNLGLRALADRYAESERTAVLYLDLNGPPRAFRVTHGSARTVAPLGVLAPLLESFRKIGVPLSVAVPFNELYRMGLVGGPAPLAYLQQRDFPALLVDADPRRNLDALAPITADRFAEGLYSYAAALISVPEEADRRYFLFSFGLRVFPVPEGTLVALFALTAAAGLAYWLFYSLTHRRLLVARGKVFILRSWALVAFLAVLFLSLLAAGAAVSASLRLSGAAAETPRYGAAALKLALTLALYLVAVLLLGFLKVPRRTHFYSAAATLLIAAGCFLAAMIDFTFVPLFLWAFAWAFIASLVRAPSAAFLFAGLAPLQLLAAGAAAVGSLDGGTARLLLSGNPWVNLFLAFVLLPFLFLFRRAAGLARSGAGRTGRVIARYSRVFLLCGIMASVLSYAGATAKDERASAVPVREEKEAGEATRPALGLRIASTTFLDRRTLRITVNPEGRPARVDLSLESKERISIYEAPAPYAQSDDGTRVRLTLGERPTVPLVLELTLPLSAAGTVRAAALYTEPFDAEPPSSAADFVLTAETTRKFGNAK